VKTEILQLLAHLENDHSMEILYACESGSRAWGFASPDSDYDIRFLYRRPMKDHYRVVSGPDQIEIPIKDDLDPGGWELRKSLGLLAKSNGALIEWLHSPVVYRSNNDFLSEMRVLARDEISHKALIDHYRGMAYKVIGTGLQKDQPTGKSYLYALRAVLCARQVLMFKMPPPVLFTEMLSLLPDTVRPAVDELLIWKEQFGEKDSPGRLDTIDDYLEDSMTFLSEASEEMPRKNVNMQPFDELLHRWSLWP